MLKFNILLFSIICALVINFFVIFVTFFGPYPKFTSSFVGFLYAAIGFIIAACFFAAPVLIFTGILLLFFKKSIGRAVIAFGVLLAIVIHAFIIFNSLILCLNDWYNHKFNFVIPIIALVINYVWARVLLGMLKTDKPLDN